jgi:hypothetical protein
MLANPMSPDAVPEIGTACGSELWPRLGQLGGARMSLTGSASLRTRLLFGLGTKAVPSAGAERPSFSFFELV